MNNERIKDMGISPECQLRAKCLTGESAVDLRNKRVEEIELRAKHMQSKPAPKPTRSKPKISVPSNVSAANQT